MGKELWCLEVRRGAGLRDADVTFLIHPLVSLVSLGKVTGDELVSMAEMSGWSHELGFRWHVCAHPSPCLCSPVSGMVTILDFVFPVFFSNPSTELPGEQCSDASTKSWDGVWFSPHLLFHTIS